MTNIRQRNKNCSNAFSTLKIKSSVRDLLKEKIGVNVKCIKAKISLNKGKNESLSDYFSIQKTI